MNINLLPGELSQVTENSMKTGEKSGELLLTREMQTNL